MLLVLIFFIIVIAIITLKIKLTIKLKNNKKYGQIEIYIFGKVCIYKASLYKLNQKFNNMNKKITNKITKKIDISKNKKLLIKIIQSAKLRLENFNLKMDICTNDAILTSYFVGIIASGIGILLKFVNFKIDTRKFYYKVNPIYSNKKVLNIKLKCIISVSLVHIIVIIFRSIKDWRCKDYGRKSPNRKAHGNCNE